METANMAAIIGGLVAVFAAVFVIFVGSKKKKDDDNEK
ncbi:MAG: LPXTG cell wall anchor domain-containing protein [Gammaproteobacteria bacterium]|nr:LPXTG cell wall anchor domain-containing protein [Gammaproteobacteria bacterium]